ncbi:MAG TPA: RHS repeat-associated core domain-containing protein [Thermoanaerobaculia bacterium]|nr:RHS repeat-associated core domain-containing protein [Thermoanaerobaculia bacterium]
MTFALQRAVPQSMAAELRHQKGFNKFVSPWVVAIADPRASIAYSWPSNATDADRRAAGCNSCARPRHLQGLIESQNVWELYTNGRLLRVRPDLCSAANCTSNAFSATPYAYLGRDDRFTTRISTIMADTVRAPLVLVAANHPPVAGGALQETTYLHSGELETSSLDLDAGGRNGWNVAFDRTYRSRTIGGSPLGAGWDSSLFRRLRGLPDGSVEYRDGAGEIWRFALDAQGHFTSPTGLFLRLARSDRGYVLVDQQWRVTGFDALGRIAFEADEFAPNPPALDAGNVIRYLYDGDGRLAQVVDPNGRATTLRYDANGLLDEVQDWRGRIVHLTHANDRLTAVQLPKVGAFVAPTIRYAYDSSAATTNDALELAANLHSIQDPGGATRVTFGYGSGADRDKVTSQTWATGESATFTYEAAGAKTIDALKQERHYQLTANAADYTADRAHIKQVDELDVPVSTYAFGTLPDAAALTTLSRNEHGRRTFTYEYNEHGLLARSTLAGVRETTYAYNGLGGAPGVVLKSATTSALGTSATPPLTRTYLFADDTTADGNRATLLNGVQTTIGGASMSVRWPRPSRKQLTDAAVNSEITETLSLDDTGRAIDESSAGGNDASGSTLARNTRYLPSTATEALRALPESVTVGDTTTRFAYSSDGLTTTVTDPRGVETTATLDEWLRPKQVTSHDPQDASLQSDEETTYDIDGRVTSVARKRAGTTLQTDFAYDALGRLTSSTVHNVANAETPDGTAISTVTYDLAQRTITRYPAGGAEIVDKLDGLGRLQTRTTKSGSDGDIVEQFVYDIAGNLVWSGNSHTAGATAFDIHDRAVETLQADHTRSVFEYDPMGRVTATRRYGSGGTLISESTATFTAAGQLERATAKVDAGVERTLITKWDGAGRTTFTDISGRIAKLHFDAAGRLDAASIGDAATTFSRYEMSSAAGDLVKSGRIIDKSGRAIAFENDYDAFGNVKRNQVGLLEWKQDFDEDGNVVAQSLPARGASQYAYDARGNVLSETRPDDTAIHHGYDITGAAISYRDGYRSQTVPDGEKTITENDALGRPKARRYADDTHESWTYDAERLQQYIDRQGRIFRYVYDFAGRVSSVTDGADAELERYTYDDAGRLLKARTADAESAYELYDYEGHPGRTVQTRFRNHSGFAKTPEVLDSYVQTHEWNEHGERSQWTMPRAANGSLPAQWTERVIESHDAAGNATHIDRQVAGGASPVRLLTADYRDAGRPSARTVTTDCANESGCTSRGIIRAYDYNDAGQMTKLSVTAPSLVIAGSEVSYDGVQVAEATLLGVSANQRSSVYTYDALSRVASAKIAMTKGEGAASTEKLDPSDFRFALERPSAVPGSQPSLAFEHRTGHKIATATRGAMPARSFRYCNGAERVDDGRFTYEFDARGRLIRATEIPPAVPAFVRRFSYDYSASDRVVGRRAEYAQVTALPPAPPSADCAAILALPSDAWHLEDRAPELAVDALPPDVTFVWDVITDRLVAVFDPNGQPVRQFIHGGQSYDDPIEVTIRGAGANEVRRLYPIFDEAATGTLQAIVNASGELVARSVPGGAYGEDEAGLEGPAVDRITVTKTASGAVEISLRSTEILDETSVATGGRLATITADDKVVRSAPAAPQLIDNYTMRWTLTASDWQTLTDPTPVTVNGETLTPTAISIAATSTLRAKSWPATTPFLPAPLWSSLRSSPALPAEARESLTTLTTALATPTTLTLFNSPSLAALGSSVAGAEREGGVVGWQGLSFAETATGLVYVRNRWYEPGTGTFLSPDPLGYRDSSNLYAFVGGDPVNGRDPTGAEKKLDKVIGFFLPGWDEAGRTETSTQLHAAADAIDAVAEEALNGTDDSQWFTRSAAQTMQLASAFLRQGDTSGTELAEGKCSWQVVQNRVYEGMPLEEARALLQDWDYLTDQDKARVISMGISKAASVIAGARGLQQTLYEPVVPTAPVRNTPRVNLVQPRRSAPAPRVEPPYAVTKTNYAKNFKAVSETPAGHEVHHTFFQKYRANFAARGVNIDEMRFLRGIDPKVHARLTAAAAKLERTLGRRLTTDEVMDLAVKYDRDFNAALVRRTKPPTPSGAH